MERVELKFNGGIEGNKLIGNAHVFGTLTKKYGRGGYLAFAPMAFDKAIASNSVVALWNHNSDHVLGSQQAGTLVLSADGEALKFAIDLPPTATGNDVKALVARGDVAGVSFAFPLEDATFETGKASDGKPVRIYTDVPMYEISPTPLPAFDGTSVSLLSLDGKPEETAKSQAIKVRDHVRHSK